MHRLSNTTDITIRLLPVTLEGPRDRTLYVSIRRGDESVALTLEELACYFRLHIFAKNFDSTADQYLDLLTHLLYLAGAGIRLQHVPVCADRRSMLDTDVVRLKEFNCTLEEFIRICWYAWSGGYGLEMSGKKAPAGVRQVLQELVARLMLSHSVEMDFSRWRQSTQ